MADYFSFWTHGASLIAEYTEEGTNTANVLFIQRAGWGTRVSQNQGTWNWFHLAVPSATELDHWRSYHMHAWLDMEVNNFAVVTDIHVREGANLIYSSGVNITGQNNTFPINLDDGRCSRPLVICVRVRFDRSFGQVIFRGAGVNFKEAS